MSTTKCQQAIVGATEPQRHSSAPVSECFDPELMSLFLGLVRPDPSRSARFVPRGANRPGYNTADQKQVVTAWAERSAGRSSQGFLGKGRDLQGVAATALALGSDVYLLRGDLLAVFLCTGSGNCSAVFIDLDDLQMRAGGLQPVLSALDSADIRYLLERSASGMGVHVWIPFGNPVPAGLAALHIQQVLQARGVKPVRRKAGQPAEPGAYDQIKPSGGDGGLVIVPHFRPDGTSTLVKLVGSEVIPLERHEAAKQMNGFQQRQTLVAEILACRPMSVKPRRLKVTANGVGGHRDPQKSGPAVAGRRRAVDRRQPS